MKKQSKTDSAIKIFYDKMYKDGADHAKPKGIIGFLFNKLRRFELHRVDAVLYLLNKGNRILDIGCGRGTLIIKAKKLRLFNKYFGTDISNEVIKNAKANIVNNLKSYKNIDLRVSDVDKKLPFVDKYFDTVTIVATLEHIFDPYRVVSEINRVTKKNGYLILEVPNFVWLPRRISVLSGKVPSTGDEGGWDSGHLHYFSFENITDLLKFSGYKIVHKGGSGIFSNIRNIYPELLSANIIIKAKKIKDA